MRRLVTVLATMAVLLWCGADDVGAQVLVFHGNPSTHGGAPNVPIIHSFDSIESDTLFWGSYGFTPENEEDRDNALWFDWAEQGGQPHEGESALMLDWTLFTDADWGGSSALQHYLPDTATVPLYDLSDFTHINLWYNTQVPADPAATLRLKLHDASEGLGTAPSSETEDWYSESGEVYQAQPGWNVYSVPLEDLGAVTPGSGGFSRPGCPASCWSGLWGNGELDLDKIAGFQIEFTGPQYGPEADSSTSGTIVFDFLNVSGVRYDLLASFDNGAGNSGGSWDNGGGSHVRTAVTDTVEGTGAMQFDYSVLGGESWGGSADFQVMPPEGDVFASMDDNTHLSIFYKVLEPIEGTANLVFKLFDPHADNGMNWELAAPGVLDDTTGQWQRLLLPLSDFAIPSWQNPPADAELNRNAIREIQAQVIVGSGGSADGSIIFDRLTTYGEQQSDFVAPEAVTGLAVTTSEYSNIVSWEDVDGEEGETYDIYFSTSAITDVNAPGVMVAASDVAEDTEVFVHSIYAPLEDQDVSYYYAITASDPAGNTSPAAQLGSAVTNTANGMPTIALAPPANFAADGDISEWAGYTPFHVEPDGEFGYVASGFTIDDAQDLSADVYAAADDEALYFAFDVTDNFVSFEPEDPEQWGNRWEWDNLEVFIGLYDWRGHPHAVFQSDDEPDYQFNFYGTEAHSNSTDAAIYMEGDENFNFAETDNGYVMEVKLPYESFVYPEAPEFTPQNGMRIPFNFKIHDDDFGIGTREGALVWSFDDEDNAHISPSNWFYTWIGNQSQVAIEQVGSEIPSVYALHQNYPNPFNPSTIIRYELPKSGEVMLKVYNVLGREVMTLVNENQASGTYEVHFDASALSSGAYFYQIQSGDYVQTRSMMLVR